MLAPRACLVGIRNDILRKLISQLFAPIDKARIIETDIDERKLIVTSIVPAGVVKGEGLAGGDWSASVPLANAALALSWSASEDACAPVFI